MYAKLCMLIHVGLLFSSFTPWSVILTQYQKLKLIVILKKSLVYSDVAKFCKNLLNIDRCHANLSASPNSRNIEIYQIKEMQPAIIPVVVVFSLICFTVPWDQDFFYQKKIYIIINHFVSLIELLWVSCSLAIYYSLYVVLRRVRLLFITLYMRVLRRVRLLFFTVYTMPSFSSDISPSLTLTAFLLFLCMLTNIHCCMGFASPNQAVT